ncbi:hypothetical protein [Saccharothrix yanglingensis]|uniref:hypothetical protein n=1 Tax=Saccharothrix yanglingensis TaxID=659496 RepID=UPI0027D2EB1E|nr:hypothetical protein [Saccharothrix yanglingensis]
MELRRAAFGDRPDAEVWGGLRGGPEERWLAAVVLGGQGHYAAAATALGELIAAGGLFGSLAASTLASHRRQLGGHAAARRLDAVALARAPRGGGVDVDGVDAAGARTDALLGLAADALGAGRLVEARRLHARVEPVGWRARVRHAWVAAEVELAAGHAERAVAPAETAASLAREAGALRHTLKSDLVLGTALVVVGTPESVDRGTRMLHCDLTHTDRMGLLSLSWPAALVLANVQVDRTSAENWNVRKSAKSALSCVLRRADPISRRLAAHSPWVPTSLLRSGEPPNADAETKFLTD